MNLGLTINNTGAHACVAKSFAYQELRFVIAKLVLSLDMWIPDFSLGIFDVTSFEDGLLNMRTSSFKSPLTVGVKLRN